MRYLRSFFGVVFKLSNDFLRDDEEKLTLTCVGIGYSNINKTVS